MKFVERFVLEEGKYEATLTNDEDNVLSLCRYTIADEYLCIEWIHSNTKRKGYAQSLLKKIATKHDKFIIPNVVYTSEAESFWRFFILEQMKRA